MKLRLNEDWQMTWEPLDRLACDYARVRNKPHDWLRTGLPCDVHMPLIEHGIIPEPLEGDNCFASEWTEKRSWWFRKTFPLSEDQLAFEKIVLTFQSLDAEADIWLNDVHLDHHRSAFYPYSCDIKGKARVGDNFLLVRVTSGLERYSEQDIALLHESVTVMRNEKIGVRGDSRRGMVRKPQYVYGWDWGPRVASCGIMGDVEIAFMAGIRINEVYVATTALHEDGTAQLRVRIEADNPHPYRTVEADLELELRFAGEPAARIRVERCLRSGLNFISFPLEVHDAKLWWPNGMGEQPLYTVHVTACTESQRTEYPPFAYGIRMLKLNTDRLPQDRDERLFRFEINGVAAFCKGANWIPADSIYARVTDGKIDRLLREAKEANFNMVRIWGGGIYERDLFYDKCDEYGLLIWHDFMFACAKYPDHLPWFREEAEREIDYQTRRLRNHCSIALWCGNNENHWCFDEYWNRTEAAAYYGGAVCYNEIAPRIVERNCPDIPYWNSSPYGGEHPNGSLSGDRHHWNDCMMNEEMEKRIAPEEYDKVTAKFVSEFGYVGPCRKSSIEAYHDGRELDRNSRVWQLHNNTFEKDTVLAGIGKHYVDPEQLDIDSYLLYAGLCQGVMLGYALEALRFKPHCSGALFWMYNDCWGEVGWSVIDYYLKRKIAYYFVKRAFDPVKFILRQQDGLVHLMAINETSAPVRETVEYGLMRYDGAGQQSSRLAIELPPYSRHTVLSWTPGEYEPRHAFLFARPLGGSSRISPAIVRADAHRNLAIPQAKLTIDDWRPIEGGARFAVSSDTFAHAVHFGLDESVRLSDEYFDLLPGERREITVWQEGISAEMLAPRCI